MRITSLHLRGFRSYSDWRLEPPAGLTVLVGPNAAGKTNALEAIALVASGKSFRNPHWDEVVGWGREGAGVSIEVEGDRTAARIDLKIDKTGTREYRVNGVKKRRVADVAGIVPIVSFTPDDLNLVKGPAERRRNAADDLGEQLSKTYSAVLRDYTKVIKHRNALLREWRASDTDLAPWTAQAVSLGAKLVVHRRRLLRRIIDHATPAYAHLSEGESLSLEYRDRCGLGLTEVHTEVSTTEAEEALRATFALRATDERARQATLVGPHRDDIAFLVNAREARTYASQGQQRTIALAWKLAEVGVVEDVSGTEPVLLLDDVMSELDEDRRRALTGLVQKKVQTFITTTNTGYFDPELLLSALIVEVGGGV
ncbi:MAG: DNA replication/repair protein RecF [Coriobacteriia bacterium]